MKVGDGESLANLALERAGGWSHTIKLNFSVGKSMIRSFKGLRSLSVKRNILLTGGVLETCVVFKCLT